MPSTAAPGHWGRLRFGFAALTALAACGGPSDPDASATEDLGRRSETLVVRPVLEYAGLDDSADLAALHIGRVSLNLAEVRLLGTDPRIPAEGVPVLNEDRVLRGTAEDPPTLEIALPEALLHDPDLAVFIRLGPSPKLDGASVEIRGRYEGERLSAVAALAESTDLDDDPRNRTGDDEDCAEGPDESAQCARAAAREIARAVTSGADVTIELRDDAVVDLVTTLDEAGDLEVAIGVPLERWLKRGADRRVEASWASRDAAEESLRLRLLPPARPRQARTSFGYRLD